MFVRIRNLPLWPAGMTHNSVLDELFSDRAGAAYQEHENATIPADVAEYENRFEVIAELPGVRKDNLTIRTQDDHLLIEAERQPVAEDGKSKVLHSEIGSRRYSRSFRIPKDVDAEKISAELTDGILKLTLPKEEKSLPREIQVR